MIDYNNEKEVKAFLESNRELLDDCLEDLILLNVTVDHKVRVLLDEETESLIDEFDSYDEDQYINMFKFDENAESLIDEFDSYDDQYVNLSNSVEKCCNNKQAVQTAGICREIYQYEDVDKCHQLSSKIAISFSVLTDFWDHPFVSRYIAIRNRYGTGQINFHEFFILLTLANVFADIISKNKNDDLDYNNRELRKYVEQIAVEEEKKYYPHLAQRFIPKKKRNYCELKKEDEVFEDKKHHRTDKQKTFDRTNANKVFAAILESYNIQVINNQSNYDEEDAKEEYIQDINMTEEDFNNGDSVISKKIGGRK